MGPWYVRDDIRPFQPGCCYETLVKLVEAGRVSKYSIVRGPTTKQFWTIARRVAGIAHLLGYCHACDARVERNMLGCTECGAPFGAYLDRNHLGLPDIQPLPWEADPNESFAGDWGASSPSLPPRPQATGVSSFAHDDDIATPPRMGFATGERGAPTRGQSHTIEHPGNGAAAATTTTAARPRSAATTAGAMDHDPYGGLRVRSLERRLASQRRTITILLAVLVVAALGSVLILSGVLGSGGRDDQNASDQIGESIASDAGQAQQQVPQGDGDSEQMPVESNRLSDGQIDEPLWQPPDAGNEATSDSTETSTVPDAVREEARGAIEAARAHLQQALDNTRSLDDRIASAKLAVAAFAAFKRDFPEELHPADIDETISRAERELKRLELHKLFPS
ncbi:MAG: hypothetical protein ACR2GY_03735 [Phycisphaerales bacterium]